MAPAAARRKTLSAGVALGALVALAVALPMALGAVSFGEGRVYDLLLRFRAAPPSPQVLLVNIDEEAFHALGNRNPRRAEIAKAVLNLWEKRPSLIALDLLLDTESKEPDEDAAMETALSSADTVLACSPAQGLMPLPRFQKQCVGMGSVDLLTDRDGIARSLRGPYMDPSGGSLKIQFLPLALECARQVWFPQKPPEVRLVGSTLYLGDHAFPMEGSAWRIPYCGGEGTLPSISFLVALAGKAALPDLAGKVIIMGSTRVAQHDSFSVPLPSRIGASSAERVLTSNTMYGSEIQGQALSALLLGQSITPLSGASHSLLVALLCAGGTLLIVFRMRPLHALSLWVLIAAALFGGAVAGIRSGHAFPLLALSITALCYAAVSFSWHRYRDFAERRAVERLFSRYVSPNIAKKLLLNPELVQLGGRRKVLTMLFSDVRGFTSLSERIPPEQVSALLNEYFTQMTKILFDFDGTLDKFIGDAILAFFGDPVDQRDHASRALACAVAMQEEAARLRDRFRAEGKPELRIGIAVNAGPVVVGNNGAKDNFVYTVIGDAVNLTARLQGLAVKDDVILSLSTSELIPGFREIYQVEEMEPVMVKGKAEPIRIVRVASRKETPAGS